ncbi:ribonuclease H-like domain-containing protein, partial [Tanacetum coccineum]
MFTCTLAQYVAYKTNVAQQFTPQKHYRLPHPGQGILSPAPTIYASQPTPLPSAFSTMPLQDPTWLMDTGASSDLNFNASNLSIIFDKRLFPSVHVGDGKSIPVTNTGHSIIPSHHRPLHLHDVLVTPNIIKNLISVRQFTRDNNCTIEFDAFGFSVKDYLTRHILLRCDSSSDLYPVTKPLTSPSAFLSTSASTWHQRLGHPGDQVLRSLVSSHFISCNKEKSSHICHACQLGKHVKLPFHSSDSTVEHCFDIIHSDLWTSPIHKFHADGTLSRYNARLVANGSSQQLGVDLMRLLARLSNQLLFTWFLAFSCLVSGRFTHQLDVKNAFLNEISVRTETSTSCLISAVDYLLIYVDDIILTASSSALLQQIINSLHKEFDMTDLRALNYFLGIYADRTSTSLFLSRRKYALQLIDRAHMVNCNPSRTPVDTESKLGPEGVHLYASATTSLVGFTDADWAGCPSTCRSSSGYCVFLGDNIMSWSSKCKHTISRSSVEGEYRGVANVIAETAWLRNLLHELHSSLSSATLVYCDNVSAVYLSVNHVQHQRTKHIEIYIHFVHDLVTAGQ